MLKDSAVGSWFFDGHSSQNNLIHDAGQNPYLTIDLGAHAVAALLGNSYGANSNGFSVTYTRRLFSTFISGCASADSATEFPDATGTPLGVPQVGNSQIKKSAFVGFTGFSHPGSINNSWVYRIHREWLDEIDYDTPLSLAVAIANNNYPEVLNWGPRIIGYRPLKYNGDDSR